MMNIVVNAEWVVDTMNHMGMTDREIIRLCNGAITRVLADDVEVDLLHPAKPIPVLTPVDYRPKPIMSKRAAPAKPLSKTNGSPGVRTRVCDTCGITAGVTGFSHQSMTCRACEKKTTPCRSKNGVPIDTASAAGRLSGAKIRDGRVPTLAATQPKEN